MKSSGYGLAFVIFGLGNLCLWLVLHQDPAPMPEQIYELRAITYAQPGRCLNHNGRHLTMFLQAKGGLTYGSISPLLACEGSEVKVFYGKEDLRQYISVNKGPLQLEPPDGE